MAQYVSYNLLKKMLYAENIHEMTKDGANELCNVFAKLILGILEKVERGKRKSVNEGGIIEAITQLHAEVTPVVVTPRLPTCPDYTLKQSHFATHRQYMESRVNFHAAMDNCTFMSMAAFQALTRWLILLCGWNFKISATGQSILHQSVERIFRKFVGTVARNLLVSQRRLTKEHVTRAWTMFKKYRQTFEFPDGWPVHWNRVNNRLGNERFSTESRGTQSDGSSSDGSSSDGSGNESKGTQSDGSSSDNGVLRELEDARNALAGKIEEQKELTIKLSEALIEKEGCLDELTKYKYINATPVTPDNEQSTQRINELTEKITEITNSLSTKKDELEAAKGRLQEFEAKTAEREKELEDARKALAAKIEKQNRLATKLSEALTEKQKYLEELTKYRNVTPENEALNQRINEMTSKKITDITNNLLKKTEELEATKSRLQEFEAKTAEREKKKERELEDARNALVAKIEEQNRLNSRLSDVLIEKEGCLEELTQYRNGTPVTPENEVLNRRINELTEKITDITNSLSTKTEELEAAKGRLQEFEAKTAEREKTKEKELQDCRDTLKKTESALSDLTASISENAEERNRLREELRKQKEDYTALKSNYDLMKASRNELKASKKRFEDEANMLTKKIREAKDELVQHVERLTQKTAEFERVRQDFDNCQEQLQQAKADLSKSEERLQSAFRERTITPSGEPDIRVLLEEHKKYKKNYEEISGAYERLQNELQAVRTELRERRLLGEELSADKSKVSELELQMAQKQRELEECKGATQNLKDTLETTSNQLNQITSNLDSLKREYMQKDAEKKEMEASFRTLQRERASSQEEMKRLQEELSATKAALNECTESVSQLRQALDEKSANIITMIFELRQRDILIRQTRESLDDCKGSRDQLQQQLMRCSEEIVSLQRGKTELEKRIEALKGKSIVNDADKQETGDTDEREEPGPSEPGLSEPGPSEPGPSEPGPSEPGPSEPGPSEPGADNLNDKKCYFILARARIFANNIGEMESNYRKWIANNEQRGEGYEDSQKAELVQSVINCYNHARQPGFIGRVLSTQQEWNEWYEKETGSSILSESERLGKWSETPAKRKRNERMTRDERTRRRTDSPRNSPPLSPGPTPTRTRPYLPRKAKEQKYRVYVDGEPLPARNRR
jgi:uncharacterized coiled-coil DUF342 family protein